MNLSKAPSSNGHAHRAGSNGAGGDVTVALVGIGGYGSIYVSALLDEAAGHAVRWIGAVDPNPRACRRIADITARAIPVYPTLDALFAEQQPQLVVISSPIHLHSEHTVAALRHGAHVLCEKPLCVTLEQARDMIEARDHAAREVAIAYQWSFCPAVQRLKRDIVAGLFGRPKRLKAIVLWPRDERYYGRNTWAGRQFGDDGEPIFDSPLSNACAHYLHNMLYLLGERVDRSAVVASVTAELYRAHPIENFDTVVTRLTTDDGVPMLFVASHVTRQPSGPAFSYEFEHATLEFSERAGEIVARFHDGTSRSYGWPAPSTDVSKLWMTADAIRRGEPTVCGIEAALPQTQVVWAAQQSMPQIVPFPITLVHRRGEPGSRKTFVAGLEDVLIRCYDHFQLPSELNVAWSTPGRAVRVPDAFASSVLSKRHALTVSTSG